VTATEQDAGGTIWDAPNQQVVREDQSAPWDEGTGGVPGVLEAEDPLAGMTKSELLAEAEARGVQADDSMTKAEITEAIEATK